MIALKPILILAVVLSAMLTAWTYHQRQELKALKKGALLLMDPNDAVKMQRFKDR
jgi:cell division protein FtsL